MAVTQNIIRRIRKYVVGFETITIFDIYKDIFKITAYQGTIKLKFVWVMSQNKLTLACRIRLWRINIVLSRVIECFNIWIWQFKKNWQYIFIPCWSWLTLCLFNYYVYLVLWVKSVKKEIDNWYRLKNQGIL